MKTPSALLLFAGTAAADYMCPAMPSMTDSTGLSYGYQIQQLLNMYYKSVPVNASFFSGLPGADMMASNGMTLAENTVTNVEGIAKQAVLGAQAIMEEVGMMPGGMMPPSCAYTLPPAMNASAHLMNAFYLEATLCGAFIGLADYLQSPTLNSLSARLAAEHGIHAAAIRGMMQPVGFMPNSTMLTPAFTPDMVLSMGMDVGQLGTWLAGCNVMGPEAPCGGMVSFGPLLPMMQGAMSSTEPTPAPATTTVTGSSYVYTGTSFYGVTYTASSAAASMSGAAASMSVAAPATYTGSMTMATPATFTGEANMLTAGVATGIAALLMAYLMA